MGTNEVISNDTPTSEEEPSFTSQVFLNNRLKRQKYEQAAQIICNKLGTDSEVTIEDLSQTAIPRFDVAIKFTGTGADGQHTAKLVAQKIKKQITGMLRQFGDDIFEVTTEKLYAPGDYGVRVSFSCPPSNLFAENFCNWAVKIKPPQLLKPASHKVHKIVIPEQPVQYRSQLEQRAAQRQSQPSEIAH